MTGQHDRSEIVIDEIAGQWLALIPSAIEPIQFAAAFLLFRAFDILKPWPIGLADRRIKGGFGVVFDDLLAGAAAALCLVGLQHLGLFDL